MSAWAKFAFEVLASTLAPDTCAACSQPVPMLTAFCRPCAATLVRIPPDPDGTLAAFAYGGALAEAITRFKYNSRPDLARPLSALLARTVLGLDPAPQVVTPVPLYPSRLVERGYNQAALLASCLARGFGACFAPCALVRTRDTTQQAKLDRGGRMTNVAGAFEVRQRRRFVGRRVLLVDDVRTTGATLRACALALRQAGASEVQTAVLALADMGADHS